MGLGGRSLAEFQTLLVVFQGVDIVAAGVKDVAHLEVGERTVGQFLVGHAVVGARADKHVHHQGLVLLLVLQELVALGEDLFRRPSPHLADEGCVLTLAGGQRCKRMDK